MQCNRKREERMRGVSEGKGGARIDRANRACLRRRLCAPVRMEAEEGNKAAIAI